MAIRAHKREEEIQYIKTILVVQSIMYAADKIISVLSGSGSAPNPDKLNELLGLLQNYLLPDEAGKREEKALKIKKILEDENNAKPFKVIPMSFGNRRPIR